MKAPQNKISGVLTGLMMTSDGKICIGLSFSGVTTHVVSVQHAGVLFNQLGDLLEAAGFFEDEPPCAKEAKCKLH